MAHQIKKKYIKPDAIDGSKIKLLQGESIRTTDSQGQEKDLIKLTQEGKVFSTGKEISFKEDLDLEKSRAALAEQAIESTVESEISSRISGDEALQVKVSEEVERATQEEESLRESIEEETLRASQAESSLSDQIQSTTFSVDEEKARALAAEASIRSQIDAEQSARTSADQSLQSQISNILSNVDPAALDSLTEIVQAFQGADMDLYESVQALATGAQSALQQEISRAQAAESALQLEVDQVESDLQQEVLNRQQDVDAEETRALAAESSLQSGINAEQSRAQSAESSLQLEIDQVESDLAQEVLNRQQDVDQEETRALAAESFLQSEIDSEVSRAQAAEAALQFGIDGKVSRFGDTVEGTLEFISPGDPRLLSVNHNYLSLSNMDDESAPYANIESDKIRVESESLGVSPTLVEGISEDLSKTTTTSGLLEDGSLETTKKTVVDIDENQFHTVSNSRSQVLFNRMTVQVQSSPFSIVNGQKVQDPSQVITRRTNLQGGAELTVSKTSQSGESNQIIANAEEYARIRLLENGVSPAMPEHESDVTVKKYVDDRDAEVSALVMAEETRALAAEAALQLEIDQVESDLQQEVLDRQDDVDAEEARAQSAESALQLEIDKVESDLAQEVLNRQQDVHSEESRALAAEASLQSQIEVEQSRALSAEAALQLEVDQVESNLEQEISNRQQAVDAEETRALAAESSLQSQINSEESSRTSADAHLQSQINNIISNVNPEALDSLTELVQAFESADVDLYEAIQSLGVGAQSALQQEISRAQAAESALQSETDQVESDLAQEVLNRQQDVDEEESRALAAESVLSGRISPIEESRKYEKYSVYEDNLQVRADGAAPKEDVSSRDGWYFKNESAGQKINWYFFDGMAKPGILLGDFSAHAVMTFDNAESPIIAVYTKPTGTNDVIPGFAHSRVAYSAMSQQPQAGTKYLVYFGQNPTIHPELPRIQLAVSTSSSAGERSPTEQVLTSSFGSNSTSPVSQVQFMVESLGGTSSSLKFEVDLRIKKASLSRVSQETVRAMAEEAELQQQILTVGMGFNKETFEMTQSIIDEQSVTLSHKAFDNSTTISVDRLFLIEDIDYTMSIESGVSKITFIGSILENQVEAFEIGDLIKVRYFKDFRS